MFKMERVREASARYYKRHSSDIIGHKTIEMVKRTGRIPRQSTIEAHGLDEDLIRRELFEFASTHPSARATKRILRRYEKM
jgi:hypothetical protein